jgi:hypothetical protein
MTEHLDVETLSAYADRELDGAVLVRAEGHLGACATCRDRLNRVRSLVQAAAALPRDVAPPPEVWPGILRGIRRRPRRPAWPRAASLAAAAVVVFAAGTMLLRPGRAEKLRRGSLPVSVPAALVAVERQYEPSIAELRFTLEQQSRALAPATVRILERSLAVIDTAIAEARAALAADPGNQEIAAILAAQYRNKVNLLQRATKLSPST